MDMKDMLRNATLESQGHTGLAQNFDPFAEGETEGGSVSVGTSRPRSKYRIEVDWRTLVVGVLFFLAVAGAGVYFAYTAAASTLGCTSTNTSTETKGAGQVLGSGNGAGGSATGIGPETSAGKDITSAGPATGAGKESSSGSEGSGANLAQGGANCPVDDRAVDIDGVVNLNKANLQDLQTLSGVGPSTAQRILDYRNENGEFKATEDIMQVKGIGEATYEKLKSKLKVK
ncbi:hypothetical protein FACS1894125_6760 [Actinomycetota bacterium]|nr:hypothetical protein FACS1894125_6760 [Actinomycetota bacterium]